MNELTDEDLHPANVKTKKHVLPPLKYEYDALAPCIDLRTMMVHHDNHHASYVKKLNKVLESYPEFQGFSALWLLLNLEKLPEEIRLEVHHNAGGHVNHSIFWRAMKPSGSCEPKGLFREAIDRDFGSLINLKSKFAEAGTKLFGSGWVWLTNTRKNRGKLEIICTNGHDHPMMQNRFPLLLNDVWEHAYYLQYESRRDDYMNAWWSIIDWDQANRCFESSDSTLEKILEIEGKQFVADHKFQI